MKAKIITIIIFFCICGGVIGWGIYERAKIWWTASEREIVAESEYRAKYWERKTATIERNDNAVFWLTVGSVSGLVFAAALGVIAVTTGKHRELVRRASVFFAKIGRSEVPVHYKDLSKLGPVYAGLTAAEQMYQTTSGQTDGLHYYKEFAEIAKTMAQGRAILTPPAAQVSPPNTLPDGQVRVPTFADMLHMEMIAPGKPLILGFHHGQPQHRDIKALKSLAVAGWQGSGKTISMGYLIASALVAADAQIVVIDPHKGHDEGLSALIHPLEETGNVRVINPFDTPKLISELNATLDRRLRGDERSDQAILLVIDELARMADVECFETLIKFLERCTAETRKANMTFIGGSQKWTARHFKGRADIRACMNSALVHKTKPSQAELLLEDAQEKKMVKELQQPGDAILVTDFADARLVRMPFCARSDMYSVAKLIGEGQRGAIAISSPVANNAITELPIPTPQIQSESRILTPMQLAEKLHAGWKQREIERQTGINQSKISNFKNGNETALNDKEKQVIFDLLFSEPQQPEEHTLENHVITMPGLPDNQLIQ